MGSHSEFRGQLDEVMLFSRALQESEVSPIYRATYRGQDSFSGGQSECCGNGYRRTDAACYGCCGYGCCCCCCCCFCCCYGCCAGLSTNPSLPVVSRLPDHGRDLIGLWPLDGNSRDCRNCLIVYTQNCLIVYTQNCLIVYTQGASKGLEATRTCARSLYR